QAGAANRAALRAEIDPADHGAAGGLDVPATPAAVVRARPVQDQGFRERADHRRLALVARNPLNPAGIVDEVFRDEVPDAGARVVVGDDADDPHQDARLSRIRETREGELPGPVRGGDL